MIAALTSIIIINYETPDLTDNLLQSLDKNCKNFKYEIILIDNGSCDGSVDFIKEQHHEIKIIVNDKNIGFASAANQGARVANGEYLWFLNSDCLLNSSILDKLVECLNSCENAAIVTPRTINHEGEFQSVCRHFPTYKNIIFSRGSVLFHIPFLCKYHENYTLPDYNQVTRVDAVAGTAMLVRAEDFADVDGFDERFFMYFEDTDLCKKLNLRGKYCYYFPDVELFHFNKSSSQKNSHRRISAHHKSTAEYFLKWFPGNYIGNILLIAMLCVNFVFQILIDYVSVYSTKKH